jgi:L-threonylcarbamoyladenylate synthase
MPEIRDKSSPSTRPAVEPPAQSTFERAAALIRAGDLVAFPTETVYGLGADATNGEAVARIYAAKGRPSFNPLIAHVASLEDAKRLAVLHGALLTCAEAFWPGPLTIVAKRRPDAAISDLATAGLDTVAIRVPSHPTARALLEQAGCPVVAPSANRSGHVSATQADHVVVDLGASVAMVIDDGPTAIGLESTIIAASADGTGIVILRAGGVTGEDFKRATGLAVTSAADTVDDTAPNAPGQLTSHYAPAAKVRLNAVTWTDDEALLAFGSVPSAVPPLTLNLSPTGDLIEAAANLFRYLRELDARGAEQIAVMQIPETGLGMAINDRLKRAAAPR